MAGCLTDLAKTYVEKLINGAIAETRPVFCFTCIANEFEEEKVRLEAERITLEQRAKVAAGRDKDIQANVCFWEKEVDKIIQEDIKTKKTCFFGLCPDCIWRYKRGKELANKMEEIKRLTEKGEKLENIELPRRLPDVERYSSEYYIAFKSRESKYKELLDALKDDNNYIIGLQGMGGTGKTTLAKEVGKELKQSEQFSHVIDTTVSFNPDIKKIQDDIAGPLGLKWEDCNDSDRPKKLWSRLINGEKILLIMDDVWDRDIPLDFDQIGIPKRDNHKGCRILITTRSKRIFNKMDCDKNIELELLSEEESWTMFKRYAGISDSSSKNLISKGRKIANECKRLPVAIAVIASRLKGQQLRKHEWDVTLKSLKKHVSMHGVDDYLVGIYKCLKISYDYMKDEKAKGLFLLSSVFPEDKEISIGVLTRLGIGTGLLGEDYGSYDDARNQVVVAKNKLIDSCLLVEAGERLVKMHDLVRDAAQWIANKEIRGVNLSNKDQKSSVEREKNIKYLFCEGKDMDFFSCKYDGSKLETLIVNMDRDEDHKCTEVPISFFENIVKLRVLYFSANGKQPLSLPHSIQSLANIRSMLIEQVDLGDISVLGNLQSLETLDLIKCTIIELPHKITKLGKFKLLTLAGCEIRRNNPFEVIERCSALEELYFLDSFNSFCLEITLPELQIYRVCKEWHVMNYSLSKYVSFCSGDDAYFFSKETFKYCMQTAEVLQLDGIKEGWKNLMPEIVPIDLGMNDLVELRLRCISQLQCLIDTIGSQVPKVLLKLVVLELNRMENLKELFNGSLSFDSLKNLEKLLIKDCQNFQSLFNCKLNLCNLKTVTLQKCPMLVSLFPLSTFRNLVLLEKLHIVDCEGLKNIIKDERREEESIEEINESDNDNKSYGSMFPKLKVLHIEGCHRLESVLPILSCQDLQVLESIRIIRCDELKYIFGKYQHVQLGSLKQIQLCQLPNFKDIFPKYSHSISSLLNEPSSTSRDGFKAQIQLEPIKCNIFSWSCVCCHGHATKYRHKLGSVSTTRIPLAYEDQLQDNSTTSVSHSRCLQIWERVQCLPVQPHIMCNIKEITLSHFLKIKSVFTLSIAPRMLVETLSIRNCHELKHILVDIGDHDSGGNNWGDVFPKLKSVYVEDCMQLEYIVGQYSENHQNHTEIHLHLPALQCLNLCNLPSLVAMCPKQYCTTFPPLKELELKKCNQIAIKSIGEFIIHSVSESLDSINMKELTGSVEHFSALESLMVYDSKAENIFCLNEIHGQQINLRLQRIGLYDLHDMMFLFVGPKDSFALKNLTSIKIVRCEKLEIVFSTSILRCLSQLLYLRIEECKELKYIIEDDMQNQNLLNSLSSKTCLPKLKTLAVVKCYKLKCVFPVSICKELPELKALVITEADELEEIFKSECDQKVQIPNLNIVVFDKLPSLFQTEGIQFEAAKNRFVQNCQNLSLTSTLTPSVIFDIQYRLGTDFETMKNLLNPFQQLQESKDHDPGDENLSAETNKDNSVGIEVETALGHELTSSQIQMKQIPEAQHEIVENDPDVEIPSVAILPMNLELVNEQSMSQQYLTNQQHPHAEIDTVVIPSRGNDCLNETEDQLNHEGYTPVKIVAATMSTISDARNELPIQLVSPKQKEQDVDVGETMDTAKTNDDQVSPNDDVVMKVSSIIEEHFSKDDEFRVSKSKPSLSNNIPLPLAFQTPSMPYEVKTSQIMEDFSSPSLVMRELEQLVSKKHLDYENLSLLTDFLVKHPSVILRDTSLSNRYKGYAYNCLAELLKFLQTHSVLDVLGSCHFEFVEILQDVRRFGFDKDWLDGVEKRALFPDLQFSQDALLTLLDSKKQVTKDVEVMRSKIDILTQHVEDLKHQLTSSEAILESIIQQEAQVLESKAALSAPLGY
ncbi:unnamed protein product [Trifolium pratense]|uniref:Uncharacterized protein n=1 Tax=Trifolium pratense TaxID=57577 RepID=A0ACB0J4K2_TRIPR|nr:unnamed protein product [Trifolium pratense]